MEEREKGLTLPVVQRKVVQMEIPFPQEAVNAIQQDEVPSTTPDDKTARA